MARIELIPWDPESEEHIERMIAQRVQCGWASHQVRDPWTTWQKEGMRSLFWLVLVDESDPTVKDKLEEHFEKNPTYRSYLKDTCKSVRRVPRTPSGRDFHPVGHIALDTESAHGKDCGTDLEEEGFYWIGPLYVVWELQAGGLGRAAMDAAEAMATEAPLNARGLGLDTLDKKHHEDLAFCTAMYGAPRKMTNQGWYERRGYEVVLRVDDLYYAEMKDPQGKQWNTTTVFMKKKLLT